MKAVTCARSFLKLQVFFQWVIVPPCLFSYSNGAASFNHTYLEDPYYVVKEGTARFNWSYSVNNRKAEFKNFSPVWYFKNKAVIIGRDNGFDNSWTFLIDSNNCPARLTSPTLRVSREDQATLVIKEVTTADSGVYGCILALKNVVYTKDYPTDTVKLIVTETPTFTVRPNPITTVVEHTPLDISCTAVGPPQPNITWVEVLSGNTEVEGKGTAVLRKNSIKRDKNGTLFKCLATNNPHQNPMEAKTTIVVYYAPEIKSTFVERAYCIEDTANITVSVDGNPKPTITCKHGQEEVDPKVHFTNDDPYNGNYTCNVTNSVGSVTYVVQLIKTNTSCQPTKPTPAPSTDSVHPGIIAGAVLAAILLIVGVVIAIIFWRRRKTYKRDSTTSHNQTVHMKDLDDGEEQYATAQHANRAPAPKEEPTVQYAVVDKSKKKKKKQPGELIYADLDHEATTPSDRPPSDRRPTGSSDQDTVYADINRAQEETPRYGNLKQMDNM